MATPNSIDYFAIRNTLARNAISLDLKDYELLRRTLTPDAAIVYSVSGELIGVDKLIEVITKRLAPVDSQHALTTQHIEIAADGKTAEATTYYTALHFGKGKWEGKEVTAWGIYRDKLVCSPADSAADQQHDDILNGSSGRWLICNRHVQLLARMGCEDVMWGEDGQ